MGRKTLDSFPEGKPLKNRVNIVLSTHKEEREGCIFVNGLNELFKALAQYDTDKVFVIGGMQVYKLLLPYCSEVLVTKVDAVGGADAFFENLDANPDFQLVHLSDDEITNGYKINFATYKNNKVKTYNQNN
jgi:dihydrofolate reductase